MSRLAVFSETPLKQNSRILSLLSSANINPAKQAFATADSEGELVSVMEETGAEFALLCGEVPLHCVRPDLTTKTACGRPFYWGEKDWGMLATVNPEGLDRNEVWEESVSLHLNTLVRWAMSPDDMLEIAPESCTVCAGPASKRDADLLPFCVDH